MNPMLTLLVQIAVILLLSRIMQSLMQFIRQPRVVGEMIAGIMLGPSLLGLIDHGRWMNALFPQALMPNLEILAQLGVMLFMFLVGLELEPKLLRGQGKAALATGTIGIIIPFLSGCALAMALLAAHSKIAGPVKSPLVFCAFLGAAMSITAFPVLARILTESNVHKTKTGTLALACAAMDDMLGWCVLAVVLALAQMNGYGSHGSGSEVKASGATLGLALRTFVLAGAYVALMVLVVRRMLGRLKTHFESSGTLSQNALALIFLLLLASSAATDAIGIHQIFGAFLLGAVMPKESRLTEYLIERVEDFTLIFLLPLFFAFTGLRTELGLLHAAHLWVMCGIVVGVAALGKFGGVSLAARFYGMPWRQSALLGVLMNTRGLMELIILNIGLTFGVLSKPLFAMMVVMALATTLMTAPLMRLLYSPKRQRDELQEAEGAIAAGAHVLVSVSLKSAAKSLVRVGGLFMAGEEGRLFILHLNRPEDVERDALGRYAEEDGTLDIARRAAGEQSIPCTTVNFVSHHIGRDIADMARRRQVSWVVMGWRKPAFMQAFLGGVVGQVLRQAPTNVAVFIDKGLGDVKRILVPYLGGPHDRAALQAAQRLARAEGVVVTILHVVPPHAGAGDGKIFDSELPELGAHGGVHIRVVPSDSPAALVVEESRRHDLMILGLSNQWHVNTRMTFRAHESVAERAFCSVLIAHASPSAPAIKKSPTRVVAQPAIA